MEQVINLETYPIDRPGGREAAALIADCKQALEVDGMFSLPGLIRAEALAAMVHELAPILARGAYTHARRHNIYFQRSVPGVDPAHPALAEFETVNHTICADQITGSTLLQIYEFAPLIRFLAEVMGKSALYEMDDPLARVNVMRYGAGEALNWHFDRSEFTTTLLLQAPEAGGAFEYARNLRSAGDPNLDGVADLLAGRFQTERVALTPGTLNVFRGLNTAHRVTPVEGARDRIIAVFSYYEEPGRVFSPEERIGFYGRAG